MANGHPDFGMSGTADNSGGWGTAGFGVGANNDSGFVDAVASELDMAADNVGAQGHPDWGMHGIADPVAPQEGPLGIDGEYDPGAVDQSRICLLYTSPSPRDS